MPERTDLVCERRPSHVNPKGKVGRSNVVRTVAHRWKGHVVALEPMQRLAAKLVLRAYKPVAMLVLWSEARLQSVSEKLHERVSKASRETVPRFYQD